MLQDFEKKQFPHNLLNRNVDNLILVEGINEKNFGDNNTVKSDFRILLLNHLVTTLPSVVMGTLWTHAWKELVDYVEMSVPVVLLDLRSRPSLQELAEYGRTKNDNANNLESGNEGPVGMNGSGMQRGSNSWMDREHLLELAISKWRDDARACYADSGSDYIEA